MKDLLKMMLGSPLSLPPNTPLAMDHALYLDPTCNKYSDLIG